jgi:hypothetical protein
MPRILCCLAIGLAGLLSHAGDVAPNFSLPDVNPGSPRTTRMVSPRDYIMQVTGFYFGDAG